MAQIWNNLCYVWHKIDIVVLARIITVPKFHTCSSDTDYITQKRKRLNQLLTSDSAHFHSSVQQFIPDLLFGLSDTIRIKFLRKKTEPKSRSCTSKPLLYHIELALSETVVNLGEEKLRLVNVTAAHSTFPSLNTNFRPAKWTTMMNANESAIRHSRQRPPIRARPLLPIPMP